MISTIIGLLIVSGGLWAAWRIALAFRDPRNRD